MIKEQNRATSQHQHNQIFDFGGDGHATQRILHPLEMVGDSLKAYSLTSKEQRFFVIDNILAIQLLVIRNVV
ncbi:WYL domain-containing protein [Brevibacillus choshinensis]|uniref:WYL domain-containing protein n=1 Tax=Brevibacillus choshinensis TaxID=54911 RepID=A0ABX7FIP5_BRECH|nr:WYL domain-containing protein [Brevibacillus choshinensis]QRG65196.1 WYL domain-containing protein [Brevibacillus choshinensis]